MVTLIKRKLEWISNINKLDFRANSMTINRKDNFIMKKDQFISLLES